MDESLPFQLDVSDPLSAWRAESFWTKEVETIQWVKFFANFQEESLNTLIDVGANIGVYSLYWLSLRKSLTAISCEPFPENLRLLKLNLQLNEYENRAIVIGEPLYAYPSEGQLHTPDNRPGSSGSQFGSIHKLSSSEIARVKSTTLDEIILDYTAGYVLKVDVDGLDYEILKGGTHSLKSGIIKSVLVEASEQVQIEIRNFLNVFDFVEDDRFNKLDGHSDARRKSQNQIERNRVYSLTSTF